MSTSPHTSTKGCPMCKMYKHKGASLAHRLPASTLRRHFQGRKRRITRLISPEERE